MDPEMESALIMLIRFDDLMLIRFDDIMDTTAHSFSALRLFRQKSRRKICVDHFVFGLEGTGLEEIPSLMSRNWSGSWT